MNLSSRTKLPLLPDDPVGMVLEEVGNYEAGDGMRITLFPTHLEVAFETPTHHSHIRIPLTDLLTAMCLQEGGWA